LFGSDGLLKIWSLSKNKELATFSLARFSYQFNFSEEINYRSNIDSVSHCPSNSMVVCSSECNLLFFDTNLHRIIKQFIGYYGEIFAAHMISNKTNCLALATNSPDLLILDLKLSHNYFATGTYLGVDSD
jgi:hypothetical protein